MDIYHDIIHLARNCYVTELNIMEFANIIEIPFIRRLFYIFSSFFGQIHVKGTSLKLIVIGHAIFQILYFIGPSFMIGNSALWRTDGIETQIVSIFSVLWQGAGYFSIKSANIISFITCLGYHSTIIVICYRACLYQKTKSLSTTETAVIYTVCKYILFFLLPHMIGSFPYNILNTSTGEYGFLDVANILLVILTISSYVYLNHTVFSVRVPLDDSFFHEWSPRASTNFLISSIISTTLSNFCVVYPNYAYIPSAVLLLLLIFIGLYLHYYNTLVHFSANITLTSFVCAGAVGCIFNIISVFASLSGIYLLLTEALVCVLMHVVMRFMRNEYINRCVLILDQCSEVGMDLDDYLDDVFQSKIQIMLFIETCIDIGHPFFFNWKIFEYSIMRYPDSNDILLLFIRVLSFFPSQNRRLNEMIQLLETKSFFSRFLYKTQLEQIYFQRTNSLTPEIIQAISNYNSQYDTFKQQLESFWESVFLRNYEVFMPNVKSLVLLSSSMKSNFSKNIENFPNSPELLRKYIDYCSLVSKDPQEIRNTIMMIDQIYKTTRAIPDVSLQNALNAFPTLTNLPELIDDRLESMDGRKPVDPVDEDSIQNIELMSHFLTESVLGSVNLSVLFIFVFTCALVALALIFRDRFVNHSLNKYFSKLSLLYVIDDLQYQLSMYIAHLIGYFFHTSSNITFTADNMTQYISPHLYPGYDLPILQFNTSTIDDLKTSIQQDLQNLVQLISDLTTIDYFSSFFDQIYVDIPPGLDNTISSTVIRLLSVNVSTVSELIDVYGNASSLWTNLRNYTKNCIESIVLDTDTSTFEILFIAISTISLFFVSLPFVLKIYLLSIEEDILSEAFSDLPNKDLVQLSGQSTNSKNEPKSNFSSMLQISSKKSTPLYAIIIFILTFVPTVAISLAMYFFSSQYVENTSFFTPGPTTIKSFSAAFRYILGIQMFQSSLNNTNYSYILPDLYTKKLEYIKLLQEDSVLSFVHSCEQLVNFLSFQFQMSQFPNDSGLYSSYDSIPEPVTVFERLCIQTYTDSLDLGLFLLNVTLDQDSAKVASYNYSLIYWYLFYSPEYRESTFFDYVYSSLEEDLTTGSAYPSQLSIALIVIHVISFFLLVCYLYVRRNNIRDAVNFLKFLPSESLFCNDTLSSLIITASLSEIEKLHLFHNPDLIVESIPSFVILDKKMVCVYANSHAKAIIKKDYFGIPVIQLFSCDNSEWFDLVTKIANIFKGIEKTTFSTDISVRDGENNLIYISVDVVAITTDSIAQYDDYKNISNIILFITDRTKKINEIRKINEKTEANIRVVSNLVPSNIISELQNSNLVAFSVQSVTYVVILVEVTDTLNFRSSEPFDILGSIFEEIDSSLAYFTLLTKIQTHCFDYQVAGGLFSTVNKPEKHAEESVKFSLNILSSLQKLQERIKVNFNYKIGIHTDGPVIVGSMSPDSANLQVLGNVKFFASMMALAAEPGSIRITRSVYELIFHCGFNISEGADYELGPEDLVTSYVVKP